MDNINSVSKGIFQFKNGPRLKELRKQKAKTILNKSNQNAEWYNFFQELWKETEEKIEVSTVSQDLLGFYH